ncbi:MAG: VanZ family protein [Candidatus Moranbacteria bacterium]|nr:VanZ family protein [Candidatus Moranbacteria bacterium]
MVFSKFSVFSQQVLSLALLLGWMGVIFAFSSLSGVATVSPPPLWYFIERKGAHVVEYAVLMLLAFRFFRLTFTKETFGRVFILAALFSLTYGATDELHQFFVPFRGAHLTDVLIDGVGVLCMGAVIIFFQKTKD